MKGQIFVLSAPSGTGKSTIAEALMERMDGLAYSVSHTSRLPRGDEKDNIDYHFVDRNTFLKMTRQNAFLEWAEVHGNLYGTTLETVQRQMSSGWDIIMDIDVHGGRNVRKQIPDSILIFLLPPSLKILKKRLIDRGTDGGQVIKERMAQASREIENCSWYDYIVINDDLETAISEVQAIITSARCRSARQMHWVRSRFGRISE